MTEEKKLKLRHHVAESIETIGPKEEWAKFTGLTSLTFNDCRLIAIPDGIEDLPALKPGSISMTAIFDRYPETFFIIARKKSFYRGNKNLKTIPSPSGERSEYLDISDCDIQ